MSDIPEGWKLERVDPPAQYKLPASEIYRDNYDRIFAKEKDDESQRRPESP